MLTDIWVILSVFQAKFLYCSVANFNKGLNNLWLQKREMICAKTIKNPFCFHSKIQSWLGTAFPKAIIHSEAFVP